MIKRNLNKIRTKSETEYFLLSITKNCETLIKQTHLKPQETLECKLSKPRETFSFKPSIPIKGCSMIGLTSLEVYNSILNIKRENNKFGLYQARNNRFSWQSIRHNETEGSLSRIKYEVLYENENIEIAKSLGVSETYKMKQQDHLFLKKIRNYLNMLIMGFY